MPRKSTLFHTLAARRGYILASCPGYRSDAAGDAVKVNGLTVVIELLHCF